MAPPARTTRSTGRGTTRPTTTRSATTSPGPRARTSSSSAEAGRSTRRSRTCSEHPGRLHLQRQLYRKRLRRFPAWLRQSAITKLRVQDNGHWNNVSWAAYIQDNWRSTRRLTLNLGLRWDGVPHTYEANNRMGNFYPDLYDPAKAAVILSGRHHQPDQPWSRHQPQPDSCRVSVLPERHRHCRPERHSQGSGEQSLGSLRSAARLCL